MTQIQKVVLGCLGVLSTVACSVFIVVTLMIATSEGWPRADLPATSSPVLLSVTIVAEASSAPTIPSPDVAITFTMVSPQTLTPTQMPSAPRSPTIAITPSPTVTGTIPLTTSIPARIILTRTPTRTPRSPRPKPSPTLTPVANILPKKLPATAVNAGDPYEAAESRSVQAINKYRQQSNMLALKRDPVLNEIARARSKDMASRGYFSHEDPAGGPLPLEKLLLENKVQYKQAGENIAYFLGPTTADVLPELSSAKWMDSPPHRENIMEAAYNLTGFGIASVKTDEGTMWYLTQIFVQR